MSSFFFALVLAISIDRELSLLQGYDLSHATSQPEWERKRAGICYLQQIFPIHLLQVYDLLIQDVGVCRLGIVGSRGGYRGGVSALSGLPDWRVCVMQCQRLCIICG